MRWVRGLVAVTVVAAVLGVGAAPAPATAAPAQAVAPVTGVVSEVQGQPWSGPAFPVVCLGGRARITCSPEQSSQNTPERCFKDVPFSGGSVTVCTRYDPTVPALKTAGGQELKLEFGCIAIDPVCLAIEGFSRGMASIVTGGMAWVIENTAFTTSSYLWTAAVDEWSWWSWVVLLVILIASMVAVVQALWSRDRGDLSAAAIRSVLAVPLSAASLWLVGTIVNLVDQLVDPLLARGGNGEGLYRTVENIIFGGGLGNMWLAQTVLVFLVVGVLVLVFVFSFRNLALAALVALGPVAFMLFPMKIGVAWVVRWFSATVALILTTPLTLGFLMLVMKGFAEVDSLWSIQALPLGLGMIMIAFTPIAVFGLFSFLGTGATSAIDTIASRAGSSARMGGARAARSLSSSVTSRAESVRRRAAANGPGTGRSPSPRTATSSGAARQLAVRPRPAPRPTPPPPAAATPGGSSSAASPAQ